ncbi:hypothetical protein AB0N09_35190 [Streptomyces erythrochromogenes]|uniref:hypothetical protein n=1 Tax=Streptomyces erythrochromogenes TaxID=285574 RepID=UPI00343A8538
MAYINPNAQVGNVPGVTSPARYQEVLRHRNGCSHAIAFRDGSLTVVCRDRVATWTETDCPDMS